MRRIMTIGMSFAGALLVVGLFGPAGSVRAEDAPGQAAFLTQKCNMCHGVSSAGIEAKTKSEKMAGGDLTGIGERRDADWIAKYVKKEIDNDGTQHKKQFAGTDDELETLVGWLMEQN